MIKDSREEEFLTKEGGTSDTTKQKTSTSTLWSTHRNPRIVRVSQAFGGKDRHSKVNTIRGLRDRRVRLSVPTAIQLYDLQDKLGLNQPSKVVDWLLDAAQHEIDKLPPLPIHLIQFPQYLSSSSAINDGITENITSSENISNKVFEDVTQFQNSAYWNSYGFMKSKSVREMTLESDIEMESTMSYNSYNQFEPNVPQEEVAQGFQSMMPSSLSLYGNNHNYLQIPSTFAQLFPANSSRTSLHEGNANMSYKFEVKNMRSSRNSGATPKDFTL